MQVIVSDTDNTRIGDEGAIELAKNTILKEMILILNKIGAIGLAALEKNLTVSIWADYQRSIARAIYSTNKNVVLFPHMGAFYTKLYARLNQLHATSSRSLRFYCRQEHYKACERLKNHM
ncbi:MAG: hypothetical protein KIT56_03870 [Gammaproteobacteria bacterium]|nr:hypothetical protein [Gammaproteobacteria bacterium]MCW5583014.1 hypothetical protein [Gammaproteobacteria bacterium]